MIRQVNRVILTRFEFLCVWLCGAASCLETYPVVDCQQINDVDLTVNFLALGMVSRIFRGSLQRKDTAEGPRWRKKCEVFAISKFYIYSRHTKDIVLMCEKLTSSTRPYLPILGSRSNFFSSAPIEKIKFLFNSHFQMDTSRTYDIVAHRCIRIFLQYPTCCSSCSDCRLQLL